MKTKYINLIEDNNSYVGNVNIEFSKDYEVEKIFTDIDNPQKFQGFKNDQRVCILCGNRIEHLIKLKNLVKFFNKNSYDIFKNYNKNPKVTIVFLYETFLKNLNSGSIDILNIELSEIIDLINEERTLNIINYKLYEYDNINASIYNDYSICNVDYYNDITRKIDYDDYEIIASKKLANICCMNPIKDMLDDIAKKIYQDHYNPNRFLYVNKYISNLHSLSNELSSYVNGEISVCQDTKDVEYTQLMTSEKNYNPSKNIDIYYICKNANDIVKDYEFRSILRHITEKDNTYVNLHIYSTEYHTYKISMNNISDLCFIKSLIKNTYHNVNCEFYVPDVRADMITNISNDLQLTLDDDFEYLPNNISLYSTKIGSVLC